MKTNYFLYLLVTLVLFSGCKKDPVNPAVDLSTTVEEDKANIHASLSELSACVGKIKDSEGAVAITDFLDLKDGEVMNEAIVTTMFDNLVDKLDLDAIDNSNKFDFAANHGTYTWEPVGQVWSKSSLPMDKIVAIFPSDPNSSTNNSTLTISGYADQAVLIDGTNYFLPTAFTANLVVDGGEIFKLSGTIAYDAPIPININVSVMLKPFTYTITGNRVSPTKFNAALNVSNGSGCYTSASIDFEFTHSDYETLDLSTDVKKVTAKVSHNSLEIISNMDMLSLSAIEDPTLEDINNYVKTNVYYNGAKIAELSTYEDVNGDTRVRVTYKDGSKEDAEVYYQPFLESLENVLEPLSGDLDLAI